MGQRLLSEIAVVAVAVVALKTLGVNGRGEQVSTVFGETTPSYVIGMTAEYHFIAVGVGLPARVIVCISHKRAYACGHKYDDFYFTVRGLCL